MHIIQKTLLSDKQGDSTEASVNYTSMVGMLQYLQVHVRPDITIALS